MAGLKHHDQLDQLLNDEGLTAKCSKTRYNKLVEFEPDKYDYKDVNAYTCVIKSDDDVIANIVFTMDELKDGTKYAYIERVDNYYPVQIERKKLDKQKHIYIVGSFIIFKAVRKAKKLGAKYILLLPLDTGSGKLFKYYKSLGFKCTPDQLNPTNFPDELIRDPTIQEWYLNCNFMIGYVDDILGKCCDRIMYKDA
jgi:hypothetical protein